MGSGKRKNKFEKKGELEDNSDGELDQGGRGKKRFRKSGKASHF